MTEHEINKALFSLDLEIDQECIMFIRETFEGSRTKNIKKLHELTTKYLDLIKELDKC